MLLNDNQRRRLAVEGKALGRKLLGEVCTIVTPDTILRWHRELIARKYNGRARRKRGRPEVMRTIRELCVMMAAENPGSGYSRIEGALANLGHRVSRSTVEAWNLRGLNRFHVLFVIDLETRRVLIAGITENPTGEWVTRVTRSLVDGFDGFLLKHRYLIHDRDPPFGAQFRALLRSAGVASVRTPPRSPNLNAYAARFVRSIKEECLSKIVPIGERHLRHTIEEYAVHYHLERNHQGLGNRLIDGKAEPEPVVAVESWERLGGILRSYHRAA